jgi:PKD repeat protein
MSVVLQRLGAVLLVMICGVLVAIDFAGESSAAQATTEGRTWVVDAVDDAFGARWLSADTGTSLVTINVGDTVEWQFDQAATDHDLTSTDGHSTWPTPVQEWRTIGGAPFRYTFDQVGTYDFICSLHGVVMSGQIAVVEPDESNQPPTVAPMADPSTGPAPLSVAFMAMPSDPDGDALTYDWDFGTGSAADVSAQENPIFRFTQAGSYVVTLNASDGRGGTAHEQITVTVGPGTDDDPDAGSALPSQIEATASVTSGTAPLAVAFSASVTTGGAFASFADGVETYPALAGTAGLTRSRDETTTWLDVTGLQPGGSHNVHVHEQACDAGTPPGGAHFRFDTAKPFDPNPQPADPNEIWLPFTADGHGHSGRIEVTQAQRAGQAAVSIVIHDPDNPAKRIGCVDLAPSVANLSYVWSFGDGAIATGADPEHVYAAPGTYTASLMVSTAGETPQTVTRTVQVVVGSATTPPAVTPPVARATPSVRVTAPASARRGRRPAVTVVVSAPGVRVTGTVRIVVTGKVMVKGKLRSRYSVTARVVNGRARVRLPAAARVGKLRVRASYTVSPSLQPRTSAAKTIQIRR